MINSASRLKYAYEDTRDMPAAREHRTSTQRCLLQAQVQPACIVGGVMQVAGPDETLRQSPREDRWSNPDSGWQKNQRSEVRWTTAGLLRLIHKITNLNSEPNSEPYYIKVL